LSFEVVFSVVIFRCVCLSSQQKKKNSPPTNKQKTEKKMQVYVVKLFSIENEQQMKRQIRAKVRDMDMTIQFKTDGAVDFIVFDDDSKLPEPVGDETVISLRDFLNKIDLLRPACEDDDTSHF
jgi:hypothetical protein